MNKLVTLAAVAMAASFTVPALAADGGARTVAYGDLDLASATGVETFNRRVKAAAKSVCGDTPGTRSIRENVAIDRCVEAAIGRNSREMQASAKRAPTA